MESDFFTRDSVLLILLFFKARFLYLDIFLESLHGQYLSHFGLNSDDALLHPHHFGEVGALLLLGILPDLVDRIQL